MADGLKEKIIPAGLTMLVIAGISSLGLYATKADLAEHRAEIAEKYIPRHEVQQKLDAVQKTLDHIAERIEKLAERQTGGK